MLRNHFLFPLAFRATSSREENRSDGVRTSSNEIFFIFPSEPFRKEKQRSYLARTLRDHDDQLRLLIKRNQLVDNELRNKIEHLHLLDSRSHEQKRNLSGVFNQKQLRTYAYQKITERSHEIEDETDRVEKITEEEIKHILQRYEENAQLRMDIGNTQRLLAQLLSRNKRQIHECSLVDEKLTLYIQLNDTDEKQKREHSSDLQRTCRRIVNLEEANHQLEYQLRIIQKESLLITRTHQDRLLRTEQLYQINQRIFHRPVAIRNSLSQTRTRSELDRYPIYVHRLTNIIEQCVQWREKLLQIDQLYSVGSFLFESFKITGSDFRT